MGTLYFREHDCTRCGVCCVYTHARVDLIQPKVGDEHPAPWRSYVEVYFKDDVNDRQELLDVFDDCGVTWNCMRMEIPEGRTQPQCVALRGQLGEAVECSIYENRPTVCREFEPGSKECRDARIRAKNLGLVQIRQRPKKVE